MMNERLKLLVDSFASSYRSASNECFQEEALGKLAIVILTLGAVGHGGDAREVSDIMRSLPGEQST